MRQLRGLPTIVPPIEQQLKYVSFSEQVDKSKSYQSAFIEMELYVSRYNRESKIKQKKCFTEIRERNYLLRGG